MYSADLLFHYQLAVRATPQRGRRLCNYMLEKSRFLLGCSPKFDVQFPNNLTRKKGQPIG